jgi:hypothetical protein
MHHCCLQGDLHTCRTPRLTNHQTGVSPQQSGAPADRQQSRLYGCFTCASLPCAAITAADGWHVAARHCNLTTTAQVHKTAAGDQHAACTVGSTWSVTSVCVSPHAMCMQTVLCLVRWHLWGHPPGAAGQPKRGTTTSLPCGKQQQRVCSSTAVAVSKQC